MEYSIDYMNIAITLGTSHSYSKSVTKSPIECVISIRNIFINHLYAIEYVYINTRWSFYLISDINSMMIRWNEQQFNEGYPLFYNGWRFQIEWLVTQTKRISLTLLVDVFLQLILSPLNCRDDLGPVTMMLITREIMISCVLCFW